MRHGAWAALVAAVAAWTLAPLVGVRGEDSKAGAGLSPSAPDAYTIPLAKRHFELTYSAEILPFPAGAKHIELWIPIPRNDANQAITVKGLKAAGAAKMDGPETATDPKTGNLYAHVVLDDLQAKGGASVDLIVDVRRREYIRKDFRGRGNVALSDEEKKSYADFLKADKLVPITGRIAELAAKIAGDEKNVLNLGRRFYDYVLGDMKYEKSGTPGWGRGDAIWACDNKHGNCTDFHAVFIGLARTSGIPARFAIGFPIPEKRGEGEVKGYHCWAEFYVPGYGWVPVDISEARKHPELAEYYFGAHTEDRVEFTMGRDLTLVPPQKGESLNFFVYPYAEADGNPLEDVKRKFAYRDLE